MLPKTMAASLFSTGGWFLVSILVAGAGSAFAQQRTDPKSPWPFSAKPGAPAIGDPKAAGVPPLSGGPSRDTKLVEKTWEELTKIEPSENGKSALAIDPAKWRHAETENFILHYRRATEGQKVAREVEYDLWFVATTLGATRERYQRKSHVYIFEDGEEWKGFLSKTRMPVWAGSFAYGDELFLNVRGTSGGEGFDSSTLAHEATHAVVARLFPLKRWPIWLSEGFAEYMGGASIAARKGQSVKRYQARLNAAEMPLDVLEKLQAYPGDPVQVSQLYQTSEKFIRYLMNELPRERIVQYIDTVLAGKTMRDAFLEVYADRHPDWDSFLKRYERYVK